MKIKKYKRFLSKCANRKNSCSKTLSNLTKAALTIPALTIATVSNAQTPPPSPKLSFQYVDYFDYQRSEDRIRVKGPALSLETPIGEKNSLEGTFLYDTISGASPLYLDTVSGASAQGINDIRRSGDVKFAHYFENFSLGIGGNFSDEQDYESLGVNLESKIWTADKNTIFTGSLGTRTDNISKTTDPLFNEDRKSWSYLLGATQVIDKSSIAQVNVNFTHGDGFFAEPYKSFDNRPSTRDEWATLLRYNRYFNDLGAALHTDYRYFRDSWSLQSHMFDVAWYQEITDSLMIRPRVRYYMQNEAEFFRPIFPPENQEAFYSADQRVSAFGSVTLGARVDYEIIKDLSINASFDYLIQRADLRIGEGSPGLEPFYIRLISVGVAKKF